MNIVTIASEAIVVISVSIRNVEARTKAGSYFTKYAKDVRKHATILVCHLFPGFYRRHVVRWHWRMIRF